MPNRDKTGPEGKGPLSGRGAGLCNKDGVRNDKTGRPCRKPGLGRRLRAS